MNGDKQPRSTLHICTLPEQPDVFLVVTDDSEPGAVPVIPTAMAEGYWAHLRRADMPALPEERSTDRPHATSAGGTSEGNGGTLGVTEAARRGKRADGPHPLPVPSLVPGIGQDGTK